MVRGPDQLYHLHYAQAIFKSLHGPIPMSPIFLCQSLLVMDTVGALEQRQVAEASAAAAYQRGQTKVAMARGSVAIEFAVLARAYAVKYFRDRQTVKEESATEEAEEAEGGEEAEEAPRRRRRRRRRSKSAKKERPRRKMREKHRKRRTVQPNWRLKRQQLKRQQQLRQESSTTRTSQASSPSSSIFPKQQPAWKGFHENPHAP